MGQIVGALADSAGNPLGRVRQPLALPVANVASTCNQIRMDLASTDADVLQMDVHLARTLEHQVQALADERIGRMRLNQLMGEPLTTAFTLDRTPSAIAISGFSP